MKLLTLNDHFTPRLGKYTNRARPSWPLQSATIDCSEQRSEDLEAVHQVENGQDTLEIINCYTGNERLFLAKNPTPVTWPPKMHPGKLFGAQNNPRFKFGGKNCRSQNLSKTMKIVISRVLGHIEGLRLCGSSSPWKMMQNEPGISRFLCCGEKLWKRPCDRGQFHLNVLHKNKSSRVNCYYYCFAYYHYC